jgi:hypothetical protein
MDAKDRIIAEQSVLIVELRREIEELKLALAKATKDSSNSSKSPSSKLPSSDIVKPPKKGDRSKAECRACHLLTSGNVEAQRQTDGDGSYVSSNEHTLVSLFDPLLRNCLDNPKDATRACDQLPGFLVAACHASIVFLRRATTSG